MRTLFHIILLSLCTTFIHAQSLHFKYGRTKDVSVELLDINLEVTNNVVRATITASFHNSSNRNQEGEMIVPLPPGATISGYELEINGEMRKASVVEKARALRAYEEIKARNIDPGIVERKANNHFRIRVFPIPAKENKKTKLTYVYRLPKIGDQYLYQLPLNLTHKVKELNITVTGECSITANKITFEKEDDKQKHISYGGTTTEVIKLTTPFTNKPTLTLEPSEDGENVHALYSLPIPENLPLTKPYTPDHITILWDTSDIANDRFLHEEIKLLEQYFQHNRNTKVTLVSIGYKTQHIKTFEVKDANWKELQVALQSLEYDGTANLTSKIPDSINKDEFTLLFSSNKAQTKLINSLFPNLKVINSTQDFDQEAIFTNLSQQQLSVIHNQPGKRLSSTDPTLLHYFITSPQESKSISVGYGSEVKHTFRIDTEQVHKTIRSPLRTIIAQENLLQLEQKGASNQVIIDYCKKHRLTSDHTSMIVLETLRDYVTYEIKPQDPTMIDEYKRSLANRKSQRTRANRYYSNRKSKPRTYPWHLQTQLPAIENIETFKQATERFFLEGQYNPATITALESWTNRLENLKQTRKDITTQTEFMQWIENASKLDTERKKFFSAKIDWEKDKDIFISLRGKVPEQKIHQLKPNTDLRLFLQNYELKSVALYRNSQRKVLNIASDAYQKTPLQTGDMIVALEKRDIYYAENENPKQLPFITDDGNDLSTSINYTYSRSDTGGGSDGFAGDPFGGDESGNSQIVASSRSASSSINTTLSPANIRKTATSPDDWKKFETKVKKNAQKAYLQLKSNSRHNNHFYTHAARILYSDNKPEIARKVLSNIIAGEEHKATAKKRHLLWLLELQDYQYAIDLIKAYDPHLTNSTIRILLIKAHILNSSLTEDLKKELTEDYQHLGLNELLKLNNTNTPTDIHITAVAETNGISKILKVDFKDTYTQNTGFPTLNIYQQGLHSMGSPGVSTATMQQAIPGEYKVSIANNIIATYQIEIVRFLGTPKATTKRITVHTDGTSKWKEIHTFTHQFPEK